GYYCCSAFLDLWKSRWSAWPEKFERGIALRKQRGDFALVCLGMILLYGHAAGLARTPLLKGVPPIGPHAILSRVVWVLGLAVILLAWLSLLFLHVSKPGRELQSHAWRMLWPRLVYLASRTFRSAWRWLAICGEGVASIASRPVEFLVALAFAAYCCVLAFAALCCRPVEAL